MPRAADFIDLDQAAYGSKKVCRSFHVEEKFAMASAAGVFGERD